MCVTSKCRERNPGINKPIEKATVDKTILVVKT